MKRKIEELQSFIKISQDQKDVVEFYLSLEYEYLSQYFEYIPLFTFQSYFEAPAIITRKLYHTMNEAKDQRLSKKEYIKNFSIIFSGTYNERIKFLYNFLLFDEDIEDNKGVSFADLKILFNNILILYFGHEVTIEYVNATIFQMKEENNEKDVENISFNQFSNFISQKDSGLYFLFYELFFKIRNFSPEFLGYLQNIKQGKDSGLNLKLTSVSSKFPEAHSKIESQKSSANTSLYHHSHPRSSSSKDMIQPPVNRENPRKNSDLGLRRSSKFNTKTTEIIKSIGERSYELVKRLKTGENEFELGSLDYLSEFKQFNNIITYESEDIDEDTQEDALDLMELTNFESELVTAKNDFSLHSINNSRSNIHINTHESLGHSFEISLSGTQEEEEDTENPKAILFSQYNKKRIMCTFSIQEKSMIITDCKENSPFKKVFLIPLRRIFPTEVDQIKEKVIDNSVYYCVKLIPVIFLEFEIDNQYSLPEYNFFFKDKEQAALFINKIKKEEKIRDIKNYYTFDKQLGKGHFGEIYLGTKNDTGVSYALKVIERPKNFKESEQIMINDEVDISSNILSKVDHDNIIKCYDVFETLNNIYIVMQYVKEGSIMKYIGSKNLAKIELIISQLVTGIKFLHEIGLVHRDLKPDNVLIEKGFIVKIIDFGLSKVISAGERLKDNFGTLVFIAPEILLEKEYSDKVDIWSLGIMAYYLLYGVIPFGISNYDDTIESVINKIMKAELKFPSNQLSELEYSQRIKKFISEALIKNPDERPSADELVYGSR